MRDRTGETRANCLIRLFEVLTNEIFLHNSSKSTLDTKANSIIIVIMGVAGSGKTTLGKALCSRLGWSFYDGDDFHSAENVEKMSQGIPLSDGDRAKWLETLKVLIAEKYKAGENIILACSALKRSYRQQLRKSGAPIFFIFLEGSFDLILKRMDKREDHYMKTGMLESQFEILEPPENALHLCIERPITALVQESIAFIDEISRER